ncbi:zinc finger protein 106, partial [Elysia marginata]
MSDLSSEASSVRSSGASAKSETATSSAVSSSIAKKLQCDLCKLSYSSDKELTEHLVSLMHHTKLDNKEEDAVHNCILCNVKCKDMADYRRHIGLNSHLDEISRLKGEKVERKKSKKSRWNSKGYECQEHHYKSSQNFNSDYNRFRSQLSANSAPWSYNNNQSRNVSPWHFNPPPPPRAFRGGREETIDGCGTMFSYQDNFLVQNKANYQNQHFFDFPHNNNSDDWGSPDHFYGRDAYRSSGGQRFEPWGSGMYRDGYGPPKQDFYHQYGNRKNCQGDRDFHRQNYFEDNQHGHWDERSLQMQEQFLASIEDNNEGRSRFQWHGRSSSMDIDEGNQGAFDRPKWGSGAKPLARTTTSTSSSEKLKGEELLVTSVQSAVDRKRPIQDEEPLDSSGSASRKNFCSRNLSPGNKNPPEEDRPGSFRQGQKSAPSTSSVSSRSTAEEIDSTSADLLLRAERLCKELREKRLASAQVSSKKTSTKQQETLLSQKLDAISQQRQQKYFKGIIKDGQDLSSADSGISTGGLSQDSKKHSQQSVSRDAIPNSSKEQQRSMSDIRKLLENTIPVSKDMETNVSQKELKTIDKTANQNFATALSDTVSPVLSKHGLAVSQRERRDSSSSTGSKQAPKAVVRPQVLNKDSLKKMINAPRSRDERLHLAKLLHSRDDAQHKAVAGAATSRPLQLEGLYDNQSLDLDAPVDAVTSSNLTSVIKLEDLGVNVREQILSIIGASCPRAEEIELPLTTPKTKHDPSYTKHGAEDNGVLSNTETSLGQKKKQQDQVSIVKKKSDIGSENIKKKKAKKKDEGNSKLKQPKSKDSLMAGKSTSIKTLDTDFDRAVKTKPKFPSSPDVIFLVDSEEEFQCSPTLSVEEKTPPKKKKKKKKNETQEDQQSQVSSSMESDDVSPVHWSSKTPSLVRSFLPQQNPNLKTQSGKGKVGFDKETSQWSFKEPHADKHGKDLDHPISKPPASKTKILSKAQKARPEQESSLNRQNVLEKFPLLLKTTPTPAIPSLSTPSSLPPSTSSTAAQMSSAKRQESVGLGLSSLHSSSTAARSYAKAVPMSSSPSLSSSLALPQSVASFSTAASGPTTTDHSVNLQLPPSIHLANRSAQPEPTTAPQETEPVHIEDKDGAMWTKSEGKAEMEENSVVVMDESDGVVAVEDDGLSLSSSVHSGEASNQAMAELLYLSEREEQIKQESRSMELRLTRLHRLLEQAVVQINKCTERRTQLQEEEKDISNKRLALLRDAAKGRASGASSTTSSLNPPAAVLSEESRKTEAPIDSVSLGKLAAAPVTSSLLSTPSTSVTSSTASSLSKADWLAKFASFLPPDPTQEEERQAVSRLSHSTSAPDSHAGQGQQLTNIPSHRERASGLSRLNTDAEDPTRVSKKDESLFGVGSLSSKTSESLVSNNSALVDTASTNKTVPTASTKVLKDLTCMYVGSFLTPSAPVSTGKPSLANQGKDKNIDPVSNVNSINPTREYKGTQSVDLIPERVIPLLEPGTRLYCSGSVGTGDDSDIGSVASSLASGTSLGEQITQYCRATPGASLVSSAPGAGLRGGVGAVLRQQGPDLSVIISSDASLSDYQSGSNRRGEEEEDVESCYNRSGRGKEDEDSGSRKGRHSMRAEDILLQHPELGRRGIYGTLNQEAVRSAEALHLMERNYQEELGSTPHKGQVETADVAMLPSAHSPNKGSAVNLSDCSGSGGGKKKKLLTRQEREASQLTRHRKRWLVSSSSDEEQVEENNVTGGIQEAKLISVAKETSPRTYCDDKGNIVIKTEPISLKQEGPEDIVVAECDSSTNLGIVDSESIRQRTQTLREMRESFERTFGRSPRDKTAMVREGEFGVGVNSTTPEASLVASKSALSKGLNRIVGDESILVSDDRLEKELPSEEEMLREACVQRFEGSCKPVCEMQVVDSHLYVGYQNLCISVFDLEGSAEKISEHPFGHLECFYVTEINETLTVIVGNGCFLTFCSA